MATRTQDLPPPGGYDKIPFKRIAARKYFSGYQMFLGYIGKFSFSTIIERVNKISAIFRFDCRCWLPLLSQLRGSGA